METQRKKPGPKPGDPRMVAYGKLGGAQVKAKYGPDHFKELGKLGGASTRSKYGSEFYSQIGRKGGEVRASSKLVDILAIPFNSTVPLTA